MTEALNIKIPHGGYVLVGDGRRALVLRNEGHALHVSLKVQHLFEAPPNPPTREQGTDRPPRVQQGERRSAIAQTDWHEIAEHRFAEEVAATLDRIADAIPALIVVAPPRTLAALRHALSDRLKRVVIAEIDKDLTKLPIEEIGQRLTHR
ncbi:host attachment protein [Methylorubrum populi]|uniref:Host attachment protein n=1 Tax=Methylorubrum populi TaxID=223967 RepID=A0A160PJV2_9HYPH|nr:host attachment protein [Methylorubrum populi]BAU92391.1 host attachment protein [Methylorubrum populi]